MSEQVLDGASGRANSAADNISAPSITLSLEPLGFQLSTSQAFRMIAKVMDMLTIGVANPSAIRVDMGAQEIRIKNNTDILLKASKPNGGDAWNVVAEHQIRRVINPDFVKFNY